MPQLALYFLGPPRVELDGKPVAVRRRKALALLAYLAVTGRSHRRDALAAVPPDVVAAAHELEQNESIFCLTFRML